MNKKNIMLETILIVGYGSIGKRHYQNILKKNRFQIVICSKRNDIEKSENTIIVTTINDALKFKPKIAFITNETSYHIKTALTLAKNNIHLFIEKPLSNSLKETLLASDANS